MNWLKDNGLAFTFHDYKQAGISTEKLEAWCKKAGWETVLNKKSTTWRELDKAAQEKITSPAAAIVLMQQSNSIIKRPVLEKGSNLLVGFDAGVWASMLL